LDGAIDLRVHVHKKIAWNLIYEIMNFSLLDFFVKISMHIATEIGEKPFVFNINLVMTIVQG